MRHARTATTVLLLTLAAPARAVGADRVAVGPQMSTLGAGGEIAIVLGKHWDLRLGGNALDLSPHPRIEGIDYTADIQLRSAGITVDWFPGDSGFCLSLGLRANGNRVDLRAEPEQTVSLNGASYSSAQVGRLEGSVGFAPVAPYAGLGWRGKLVDGRLLFGVDVGVLYQGSPDVRLHGTGTAAGSAAFQADLEAQRRSIEDDLGPLRFFPVVAVSLTYRF